MKRKAIEKKDDSYKKNTSCNRKVNQCITLRWGFYKINNECDDLCGCKSCLNGIVNTNTNTNENNDNNDNNKRKISKKKTEKNARMLQLSFFHY